MKKAIDRTYKSITKGEQLGIFGDYDVDGASSTALLARYFSSIKQKIKTYYTTIKFLKTIQLFFITLNTINY